MILDLATYTLGSGMALLGVLFMALGISTPLQCLPPAPDFLPKEQMLFGALEGLTKNVQGLEPPHLSPSPSYTEYAHCIFLYPRAKTPSQEIQEGKQILWMAFCLLRLPRDQFSEGSYLPVGFKEAPGFHPVDPTPHTHTHTQIMLPKLYKAMGSLSIPHTCFQKTQSEE